MKTLKQQPLRGFIKLGIVKRIHVDKHVIRANGARPITIQTSKGSIKAKYVHIDGPAEIEYMPLRPLKCGAKLWVVTTNEVYYE